MNVLKYPILIIAICFGIGIVLQNYLSLSFLLILCLGLFLAFLFTFTYVKIQSKNSKNIFFGLITYLFMVVCGSFVLFLHQDFNKKNHYSNQGIKEQNTIKALVVEEIKPNLFYTKFIVAIDSFNHQKSCGKLLVYFSKKNPDTLA
ncbi:MAG TPA: hypothetical protein DDZ41_00315, partial [Flavobacterium sp.]|nr:hypothetical protein [Flavobacterium sp.]